MKAIVYTQYGPPDVLQLKEVEKPTPQANEVLIKIHAASVNAADWHVLKADPFIARFDAGLFKPKFPILGADIAGVVESIGAGVTQFKPGDEVYGDLSGCGWGGFAEYVTAPENVLALKPTNIPFTEAAAVPMAALTALQGLHDKGQIRAGQKVLINGASGGVGTFAVQIAKSFGTEVTAVCSTSKMDMVRSIGADNVIDYTKEDFTRKGQQYDLILAANGYHSIFAYRRALAPNGIYVTTGGTLSQIFQALLLGSLVSKFGNKKLYGVLAKPDPTDLGYMKDLIEAGKVTPVIDRCYPLAETAEAIRYVDAGHARGKVVITM
ncbi:MAG: NAD(P)-dependent alcohol dehydrogenase [Anaerolineae bacterium]|nr:NAD(P)-dependent alcohol dehydrogenase [Anaerolineae bacterium]